MGIGNPQSAPGVPGRNPQSDEWAVDLRHVAKTYGRRVHALRGIEMRVHRGEIFGLLGPNGAGKSTLVKIMMTVVRPNRAEGTVLGQPMGDKATLARVGYLPEHPRFPGYLTGRQALEFYGALAHVDRTTRKRRAEELLALAGLTEAARMKVSAYSKGMVQRLALAQSLANEPQLVVLDEPTDGVDPVGRREIRQVLMRLRDQGKTVFLNSHLLGELEMVCDRVAILVQGLVVRQGTMDDLTKDRRFYEIDVDPGAAGGATEAIRRAVPVPLAPAGPTPAPGETQVFRGTLGGGNSPRAVELRGCLLQIAGADAPEVQPLIDALRSKGLVIRAVRPVRQSLEDLFMETLGQQPLQDGGREAPILLSPDIHGPPGPAQPPPLPPAAAPGGGDA